MKIKVKWNLLYPDEAACIKFKFKRFGYDGAYKQLVYSYSKLAPRGANLVKQYFSDHTGAMPSGSCLSYNPKGNKQFAVVKMNYSKYLSTHKKFLEEYMPQKNKPEVIEKPVVFGNEGYEERMVGRHFKFMISPESDKVPLEEFTKAYMERLSFELGHKFDWKAVVHTNTEHPHVHVLINGKDMDGKYLPRKPFPRDFIKSRSHVIASDIITNMIGERTPEQKNEAYQRSFSATRWTVHDEKIIALVNEDNAVIAVSDEMKKRLSHLCKLKLAVYDQGVYQLQKNWNTSLRNVGRYTSYLKAREELKWTLPENLQLYTADTGSISGIVRKRYCLDDEYENNNALVIEDKTGKAYFLPLYNPPPRYVEGQMCTVSMNTDSKGRLVPKMHFMNEQGADPSRKSGRDRS